MWKPPPISPEMLQEIEREQKIKADMNARSTDPAAWWYRKGQEDMRERAAKVAASVDVPDADFSGMWTDYEHGVDDTQKAAAAAIRALPTKEPGGD